jgi:MoaA/NifB/PqqE/SkfB family radical SAM enzyme
MEEFAGNNMLEFAIVSCFPSTMRRDKERNDVARDIRDSTQLTGTVGETIQGEVEIVKCFYSQEYNKYRITAKLVDSFVDFWYNKDLAKGDRVKIKGKIKTCRGDLTTQLNYVKTIG